MRFSILAAFAALFVVGCGKSNPTPDGKGTTPPPGPTGGGTDLATVKPDHAATAADWYAEFEKDADAATKKYAGKVIELTGTVQVVTANDFEDELPLYLEVNKGESGLRCAMTDVNVWEKACQGTEVTIRGRLPVKGHLNGELSGAVLVKADKNPASSFTATELASQFVNDQKSLENKHKGKWAYVEGEVVWAGKTPGGWMEFKLKGVEGCNVICPVPREGKLKVESLKVGQKLKVLGIVALLAADGPRLNMALFKSL